MSVEGVSKMLKIYPPGGYFHRKVLVILWLMIWSCCGTPVAQGRYRCMLKDFIRLGNSCYFLSAEIASWQEAHFRCRDRGSQLAVLASHYEDSTLRSYLERPEFAQLGRWIGGMWAGGKWIWAAQGTEIESERSFVSEQAYDLGETDQWMCLYMDPSNSYHWNNNNCMRQYHYICEAPLARETNSSVNDASPAGSSDVTEAPAAGTTTLSYETVPSTTETSSGNEEQVSTAATGEITYHADNGESNDADASISNGDDTEDSESSSEDTSLTTSVPAATLQE